MVGRAMRLFLTRLMLLGKGAVRRLSVQHLMDRFGKVGKEVYLNMPVVVHQPESIYLGDYVGIGENVVLRGAGGITMGNRVLIATGVAIVSAGHPLVPPRWGVDVLKPIHIGDDVWIGTNAVILPGVNIGNGAVVAAGAVVSRDVPSYAVVAGVPARVIRTIEPPKETRGDAAGFDSVRQSQ